MLSSYTHLLTSSEKANAGIAQKSTGDANTKPTMIHIAEKST